MTATRSHALEPANVEGEGVSAVDTAKVPSMAESVAYVALGALLGILFVASQVLSWYRIQEMFRFQSFHMFGVIASAVAVSGICVWLMQRAEARTLAGDVIRIPAKVWTRGAVRYWMGGLVFGLGWALLGACPGPIFTLMGTGETVFIVPLAAGVAGTFAYGVVRDRLPH